MPGGIVAARRAGRATRALVSIPAGRVKKGNSGGPASFVEMMRQASLAVDQASAAPASLPSLPGAAHCRSAQPSDRQENFDGLRGHQLTRSTSQQVAAPPYEVHVQSSALLSPRSRAAPHGPVAAAVAPYPAGDLDVNTGLRRGKNALPRDHAVLSPDPQGPSYISARDQYTSVAHGGSIEAQRYARDYTEPNGKLHHRYNNGRLSRMRSHAAEIDRMCQERERRMEAQIEARLKHKCAQRERYYAAVAFSACREKTPTLGIRRAKERNALRYGTAAHDAQGHFI
ncbi:unnamed protein product [Pedinophyceae sp. YPF-701]|nr:unnamed protein product [Pedinophyceae sp. YPF-701]